MFSPVLPITTPSSTSWWMWSRPTGICQSNENVNETKSKKSRPWKWTLYFKVLKDQRRSRDTVNLEACLHLQRVKDNPHFAQCRYKIVLRGKFASFESWNSGFWRKRGVRFGKQNCYWLLLQVGRMKWILYSDWLLEQASWPQRMFVPQEKSSLGHMINPLLTKLVWLRWLDISLMFFFYNFVALAFVSVHHNTFLPNKLTWPLSSHLWPHTWY